MAASVRRSSDARRGLATLVVLGSTLAGCTDTLPPIEGTTSLRVDLASGTQTGSFDDRLPDTARQVTVEITAVDAQNQDDTSFTGDVDIYVQFLGSLTPDLGSGAPLATAHLAAGTSGPVDLELPLVYGPTFLWIEDAEGDDASFATGTSATLWFRDPFLADVSRPEDEASLTALERSPLEQKQINVTASRYGAAGRMVVTGVYAQGYTLSDAECQDAAGTPPCTTGDYDHVFVFSFSRPEDQDHRRIELGAAIERLTGSIGEFNGLTEVNFPQSFKRDEPADPDRVPAPTVLVKEWLQTKIEMERVEEGLVEIDGATVCPVDADFTTFSQWKLDIGLGCPPADKKQNGLFINVITKGQVNDFVPEDHIGEVLPKVIGTLRPVQTSAGAFNVWIVYPRSIEDITLP